MDINAALNLYKLFGPLVFPLLFIWGLDSGRWYMKTSISNLEAQLARSEAEKKMASERAQRYLIMLLDTLQTAESASTLAKRVVRDVTTDGV